MRTTDNTGAEMATLEVAVEASVREEYGCASGPAIVSQDTQRRVDAAANILGDDVEVVTLISSKYGVRFGLWIGGTLAVDPRSHELRTFDALQEHLLRDCQQTKIAFGE